MKYIIEVLYKYKLKIARIKSIHYVLCRRLVVLFLQLLVTFSSYSVLEHMINKVTFPYLFLTFFYTVLISEYLPSGPSNFQKG